MSRKRKNLSLEDRIGIYISGILRHRPWDIGVTIDRNGYCDVQELIDKTNKKGIVKIDFELLKKIVDTDDKKRYSFKDNMTKIRANQGHTIDVDLELESAEPPSKLYHGTSSNNVDSIMKKGLNKGKRHDVHLSMDLNTAKQVGSRKKGDLVILVIDSEAMYKDNYEFRVSDNGVWLTKFVPSKYISIEKI